MRNPILLTFLSLSLCGGSLTLAVDNPAAPQPASEASRRIAAETAAAIEALGANPAIKQITAIVFKAVRSSSDSVLSIVDAAVRVSPRAAVPEIVTAAIVAVPNRWKKVLYRRLEALNAETFAADNQLGSDSNQARTDARSPDPRTGGTDAAPAKGIPMTLAEAIVHTAFDAQTGLSLSELQKAANTALRMDPATLLRNVQNPSAASGVSDAGQSNYGNEPLRTPKQPVVSR